jgi:hypothetical protein
LPAHDLNDEVLESCDAVLALATTEKQGSLHVPRSEVGQRAGSGVFVLHIDRAPRAGGNERCLRRLAWILVFSSTQST